MLNYNTSNIFKVLADEDDFEDIAPYNIIGDGKWFTLSPSPIGSLINERFSSWYRGKLMWR